MKHFVLDFNNNNPIPVVRMFDRFGRLTQEAACADSVEVRLNGAQVDLEIKVENSIYVLQ